MANSINNTLEIRVTEMTKIEARFGHLGNDESPRQYPCAIIDGVPFALQHEFREWKIIGTSSVASPQIERREGKQDYTAFPYGWFGEIMRVTVKKGALITVDYEYDVSRYAVEKGTWYIALDTQMCQPLQ